MKHRLLQATATQVACTMCLLQSLWVDLPALHAQAPISLHESSVYLSFSPVLSNEAGV